MTGHRLPKVLRRRSAVEAAFEGAMNSGAPIVDNAGPLTVIGQLEYDGPRCPGCGDAVETDDAVCPDCRCETCSGDGVVTIEAQPTGVPAETSICPDCHGGAA